MTHGTLVAYQKGSAEKTVTGEIVVFITSYISYLLSALCGGGAGLIMIPVLGFFLPVQYVPAAISLGSATSSISRIAIFYRNIRFDIVRWFIPPAIGAVWLGAWLIDSVNPLLLEFVIGIFLVWNLTLLFKDDSEVMASKAPHGAKLVIIGFLAGFVSGITGAVGLLFNRFYLRCGMNKEEIIATRAANEVLLHLIKIVLYSLFGLVNLKSVGMGVAIALAAIVSSLSLKSVLAFISETLFRKIGYFAMAFSGFLLLAHTFGELVKNSHATLTLVSETSAFETQLTWQQNHLSLEFSRARGIEIELGMPVSELSLEQQQHVKKLAHEYRAEKTVIEAVYGFRARSFEAYFYRQGKLVHKIKFN